jgi:hypothetical protein
MGKKFSKSFKYEYFKGALILKILKHHNIE